MPGLTLMQRYYGINENLNKFLLSRYVDCPIFKYGIDRATLKANSGNTEKLYPYAMTSINNVSQNAWTSEDTGNFTRFDFQVNFFTSPKTEFINDASLYKPFEYIKLAFTDINKTVLQIVDNVAHKITMLADVLSLTEIPDFSVSSGAIVPSMVLIVKMVAVCGYPDTLGSVGVATDTSKALEYVIVNE